MTPSDLRAFLDQCSDRVKRLKVDSVGVWEVEFWPPEGSAPAQQAPEQYPGLADAFTLPRGVK